MVRRVQLPILGSTNQGRIQSGQTASSISDVWITNAFVDYVSRHQMSRVTMYINRNFTAPGASGQTNLFTDMTVQPFNWVTMPTASFVGGNEIKKFVVSISSGLCVRETIIPSKKHRQYILGVASGSQSDTTASDVVWISCEMSVPT